MYRLVRVYLPCCHEPCFLALRNLPRRELDARWLRSPFAVTGSIDIWSLFKSIHSRFAQQSQGLGLEEQAGCEQASQQVILRRRHGRPPTPHSSTRRHRGGGGQSLVARDAGLVRLVSIRASSTPSRSSRSLAGWTLTTQPRGFCQMHGFGSVKRHRKLSHFRHRKLSHP